MATNYKILGQAVNDLKVDAPVNGSSIISELKIKNTSYPTDVTVIHSSSLGSTYSADTYFSKSESTQWVDSMLVLQDDATLFGSQNQSTLFYNNQAFTVGPLYKIDKNGAPDTSFNDNVIDVLNSSESYFPTVLSILEQPDQKIIVAGKLDNVYGRIIRLNSDGTIDSSFQTVQFSSGTSDVALNSMDIRPDGKIIIGGRFNTVANNSVGNMAILNSDGTLYTTNATGVNLYKDSAAEPFVSKVVAEGNNSVLVSGNFDSVEPRYSPTTRFYNKNMFRWIPGGGQNAVDTNFVVDLEITNYKNRFSYIDGRASVFDIVIQQDGKILIGGDFSHVNGVEQPIITRVDPVDGSIDPNFVGITDFTINFFAFGWALTSIALTEENQILISGAFDSINGIDYKGLARLTNNGELDQSFDIMGVFELPPYGNSGGAPVWEIALDSSGNLVLTSLSTISINGESLDSKIARLVKEYKASNSEYLIKNKNIGYDEEIRISGGLVLNSGESLSIKAGLSGSRKVVIQAYGIEETQ